MTYENWAVTTATIHGCEWEDPPGDGSSSLFVDHFMVFFSYAVAGHQHRGKFYSSSRWEEGTEVGLLYNPENPVESCICDQDGSQLAPVLECVLEILAEGL